MKCIPVSVQQCLLATFVHNLLKQLRCIKCSFPSMLNQPAKGKLHVSISGSIFLVAEIHFLNQMYNTWYHNKETEY